MKILKSKRQYVYDDFKKLQCEACKKKLWDRGPEIVDRQRLRCPQCGMIYSFEAIRWKVLAEKPEV